MNKHHCLLFLLILCSGVYAKNNHFVLSDDPFIEVGLNNENSPAVAQCGHFGSLVLTSEEGVKGINLFEGGDTYQYQLPTYSETLRKAGWVEYFVGWIFPSQARYQPNCAVSVELELDETAENSQDMVLLEDDDERRCSPVEKGFRCRLSVSSPNLPVLLKDTDTLRRVIFSELSGLDSCVMEGKGGLVTGKVVEQFLDPIKGSVIAQAVAVFHGGIGGSGSQAGKEGSPDGQEDSDGDREEDEETGSEYDEVLESSISGAEQAGPASPVGGAGTFTDPLAGGSQFPGTQPFSVPFIVNQHGGMGSGLAGSISGVGSSGSSAGMGASIPLPGSLLFGGQNMGSGFVPPYTSPLWNQFVTAFLNPMGQVYFNYMRLMLASIPAFQAASGAESAAGQASDSGGMPPFFQSCAMQHQQAATQVSSFMGGGGVMSFGGQSGYADKQEPRKRKRKTRTVFTRRQIDKMEKKFNEKIYISTAERDELANRLNLTDTQVKTWFQNRRMKKTKDQEGVLQEKSDDEGSDSGSDSSQDEAGRKRRKT